MGHSLNGRLLPLPRPGQAKVLQLPRSDAQNKPTIKGSGRRMLWGSHTWEGLEHKAAQGIQVAARNAEKSECKFHEGRLERP